MSSTLLGDARVRIRPDMTGFKDDAESGVSKTLKGIGGLASKAFLGVAGVATLAGGIGLSVAADMETAKIGFTTMLKSGEKADKFLKQLSDFAASTPFEFPELQEAASSLISAGIAADDVIPIMKTLGNVTSGMGTGSEGVQRATVALQQMSAAGKITGEDLNQLRDAGIPVYDLLAKATGKSKAEVVKLAQAGKLGAKELGQMMDALKSGAGLERFSGLMEKQSQSLSGLWSTLKDTVNMRLAQAMQPMIPFIKKGMAAFAPVMDSVLATLSSGLTSAMGVLKDDILPFIGDIKDAVEAGFSGDTAFSGIKGAAAQVGNAFGVAKDAVDLFFAGFTGQKSGVDTAFFGKMAKPIEEFGTKLRGSVTYLTDEFVPAFKEKALAAGGALLSGFTAGIQAGDWAPLGSSIGNGIRTALGNLGALAKSMGTALKDIIGKVKWGDLAYEFGKQAPTLLLGLATGLLNFDFMSVLGFLGDHIFDVILGVLGIAFAPSKLLGPIARILGRIPLAGRFIEWFVLALNNVGSKITGWVGGLFKRFGEGWASGGPGMGSAIKGAFDNAWTHIYVWADDAVIWLKGLPGRFSGWIGDWASKAGQSMRLVSDSITGAISRAVSWVLGRFAALGGWIGGRIAAGAGLVVRGIASVSSAITGGIRGAVSWALGHVAQFGGWVGGKILAGVGQIASAMGNFIAPVTRVLGTLRQKGVDGIRKLISGLLSSDLAKTGARLLSDLGSGLTNFGSKVTEWATSIKDKIVGAIKSLFGIHSPSRVMHELGGHMITGLINGISAGKGALKSMVGNVFSSPLDFFKKVGSGASGLVASIFGGGSGGAAGAGVQRWLPLVQQALAMTGQPLDLAQTLLRRMNQESGGNPNAINLTDYNATVLHDPSRGLMQTIGSTFAAFRMPGLSSNIYDPLSNIVASIRYAVSRYGSLASAYNRSGGYDSGGIAQGVGFMPKATLRPERVLSPSQTKAFEEWMRGSHHAQQAPIAPAPLIGGDLILQTKGESVRDDLGEVSFQLRRIARGGVHAHA